jgi:signal transduction histidine kinase
MNTSQINKDGMTIEGREEPVKRMKHWRRRPVPFLDKLQTWRQPLVGYICVFPLLAVTLFLTQVIRNLVHDFTFPTSVWVLAVVTVALVWGVGPTLLMIVMGLFALDLFFVGPRYTLTMISWPNIIQLLPFAVAGLGVALITSQLELSRRQARMAEQHLQKYADALEETNQRLGEANQRLEETNRQLERANRVKDRFLSITSHELKTPVTAILGQSQLLQRRVTKRQQPVIEVANVMTTLESIDKQTWRLSNLIDELLDVSRIQSGNMPLNKQITNITEICRAVVDDQRLVTGRDIRLSMPPEPVELLIDGERLTQIMTNLISNAAKYSAPPDPIEVTIRQERRHVLLQVRDYGHGMTQDQLAHIFEMFYRTPEAQSSEAQGLGLGLAIVKHLVEQHDGVIGCESEEGKGSIFFVELPLPVSSQVVTVDR